MKRIGLLGGLGPESTVKFYQYITRRYYETHGDYAYPEIIIYSLSFSKFIDCGYACADDTRRAIEKLHAAGADFAVAACNTIHVLHHDLKDSLPIPWISIMDVVAEDIKRRTITKVGLLGTKFTMSNGFYQDALAGHGIETVTPDDTGQSAINDIIFSELARGITTEESKRFMLRIMDELADKGAQGIVLGCTELPFLIRQEDTPLPVLDSTVLLAEKTLSFALE